jgi:hypothetical protein
LPMTPQRFSQKINQRHMLSALFGFVDVMAKYRKDLDHMATIFVHEMCRVSLDRIVNEESRLEIFSKLKVVAKKHFNYTD